MSTIVEMFAMADGALSDGYSTQNLLDVRTDVSMVVLCVTLCLKNVQCMSLFYHNANNVCRMHSNAFFNNATFVTEAGWTYYRTSGDPRCSVHGGFVHQRGLNICYQTQSDDLVSKAEAESACAQTTSSLAILDSQEKQDVVVDTLNLLQPVLPSAAPASTVVPVYLGCYELTEFDSRTLQFTNAGLTVQSCFDVCQPLGRTHTLLESTSKCHCGDLQVTAVADPSGFCDTVCSDGNWCGDFSTFAATYNHTVVPGPAGASSLGYYIGATLNTGTSQWFWRNAAILMYNAFDPADDMPASEECAVMTSSAGYLWHSEDCNNTAGYICEIDL